MIRRADLLMRVAPSGDAVLERRYYDRMLAPLRAVDRRVRSHLHVETLIPATPAGHAATTELRGFFEDAARPGHIDPECLWAETLPHRAGLLMMYFRAPRCGKFDAWATAAKDTGVLGNLPPHDARRLPVITAGPVGVLTVETPRPGISYAIRWREERSMYEELCGDVGSSLAAVLTEGIVRISWETTHEDSTIDHYTVKRFVDPGWATVGSLNAAGTSGLHRYALTDDAGQTGSVYSCEVVNASEQVVCAPQTTATE